MQVDFTPDPTLYPYTSQWFDSSRGRMHYVDEAATFGHDRLTRTTRRSPHSNFITKT
jgi:hypothetical protein